MALVTRGVLIGDARFASLAQYCRISNKTDLTKKRREGRRKGSQASDKVLSEIAKGPRACSWSIFVQPLPDEPLPVTPGREQPPVL